MQTSATAPDSFEDAIGELEAIVEQLESGAITLETALARYQRGMELLKFCQGTLDRAEQRIHQLEGDALVPLAPNGGQG